MTTLFDVLHALGQAAWQPVWVPVLAWTVLAIPLWIVLKHTERLHPHAEYRLSQVLLAALPAGLAAAALTNLLPVSTAVAPLPEVSVALESSVEAVEVNASHAPVWTWAETAGITAGTLTSIALGMGGWRLGRLALETIAATRLRKTLSAVSSEPVQTQADRLTDALCVGRPVRVCLASEASVPLTVGGPRPTILLPPALAETEDALQMTLVHECVHVRRYDDLAHFVERAIAALFAIHPLVNRLRCHIAEARERACDATVLEESPASRSAYARLLAAFAEENPRLDRLGALSLAESPSSLTSRLTAMRSSISTALSSPLALGSTLLGLGLALTLGIVACSNGLSPSPEAEETIGTEQATASVDDDSVYSTVEEPPNLIGGMEALQEEITYPEFAKKADIEGRVIVQFTVDKDGTVRDPEVTREAHKLLNEAAIEAVKKQEFEPGLQKGEPVNVQMSLPVIFKLPEDSPPEESGSEGEIHAPDAPQDAPQIQGGLQALQDELSYPDLVREAGIEGKVLVTFTVDETGAVQQPRVTKSVHEALDAAALEAVKSVTFTPAKKNGEPTATEMTLPITFNLPDEQE